MISIKNKQLLPMFFNVTIHLLYECPSFEECECVEINAFRVRSQKYEGNIIKQKGNYDVNRE